MRFASALRAHRCLRHSLVLSREAQCAMCTTVQAAGAALPQGPSLRSGLCCPGPSSLIWSHAPHLQAQLDFTAMRLIRAAFAVRPISAPRRPTSGSVLSLAYFLDMSSSGTDGKFIRLLIPSSFTDDAGLRPEGKRSRHFQLPHPPILVGGSFFEASLRFTFAATCRFACSPVGADRVFTQPTRAFTFGLPTD